MSKAIYKKAFYESIGPAEQVLQLGFLDHLDPVHNEVQVEIRFSGVNPSDIKKRTGVSGDLGFSSIIPHSDASGVVCKLGPLVKDFKVGDRVWIHGAGWKRQYGTAATFCTLPEDLVVPLPDHIPFETGACLGIPALTAAGCLLSLNVHQNAKIMITGGAGAVGIFAIQLAKFLGLQVIATVRSQEKAHIALSAGADQVLDKNTPYAKGDLDGLIDVDFGGNLSWSIGALKPHSTIAAYASAGNLTPIFPFYDIMCKNITIKPILVYTLEDDLKQKAIDLVQMALKENILKPVIYGIYDFEKIAEAHLAVESGQKIGQVLLKVKS